MLALVLLLVLLLVFMFVLMMLVVLVLLGLVIGGHGARHGAASSATAAASAAAQRSMDRVRGSGLPLASDRCLMAALCFQRLVSLALGVSQNTPLGAQIGVVNGKRRLGRRVYA